MQKMFHEVVVFVHVDEMVEIDDNHLIQATVNDEIDEIELIDDKWYIHTWIERQKTYTWIDENDEIDDIDI